MRLTIGKDHKSGSGSAPAGRPSCDDALVVRAQSGECGAFDALMRKYQPRIMQLAMRYTRNPADAEDVVQNTFLKAFGALSKFRGDSAFYSWLHSIALNATKTALMARRRDLSVTASMFDSSELEEGSGMPKDFDTPEGLALTDEICRVISAAIEQLCEEQRGAIVLRELEGMSYAEVASRLSCPIGTVRSRVFRARETIDVQLRHVFDNGLSRVKRVASLQAACLPGRGYSVE